MFSGVDVSKKWVDVAIYETGEVLSKAAPLKAAKWLKKKGVKLVVLEATGGYELPMMAALNREKIDVARVNPRKIRQFANAIGVSAKTDVTDAKILARYAFMMKPVSTKMPSRELITLRGLCNRRSELVAMRTSEKNRLQQFSDDFIISTIEEVIAFLTDKIDELEKEMNHFLKQNQSFAAMYKLLCSMPGVGRITAMTLLAYMPELGNIGKKEIASLAGLAPFARQSGQWKGHSFCSGGRSVVRDVLYMAALSATRMNNVFRDKYLALVEKGKPAKVALVAVMRKMLVILNSMMRNNSAFQA